MRLGELISGLDVEVEPRAVEAPEAVRICDVVEDSRTALPGSLFIARRGAREDARRFAGAAAEAGAVAVLAGDGPVEAPGGVVVIRARDVEQTGAVLAERLFGSPSRALRVAGVTGTNGKTTVAHAARDLLNACGARCGLIGTVVIDDGAEVGRATLTTPPSTEISRTLAQMVENDCAAAVLEASSHALHQRRVGAVEFDAAVFTNLSGDHLDYHGTMDAYAAAKAMLFESLSESGVAFVNATDPSHERMVRDCRARVVRCVVGDGVTGDAGAEVLERDGRGQRVRFTGPWGEIESRLAMHGDHSVWNTLFALAIAHEFGGAPERLGAAMPGLIGPPGRLERVPAPAGPGPDVYVDFAHTDDALRAALGALRQVASERGGRLVVVFGCGGDRDRSKRPRMGAVADELADRVVVTSDNPRTEQKSDIIADVLEGIPAERRRRAEVHAEREAAIDRAIRDAGERDVVLIAGKGHETEQLLPDGLGGIERVPFDDRAVAARALEERGRPADDSPRPLVGPGARRDAT